MTGKELYDSDAPVASMIFDCDPPKLYHGDGSGRVIGDAMAYSTYVTRMTGFLIRLADFSQEDGHPVRKIIAGAFLLRLLERQPHYRDGSWRGYPVRLDTTLADGHGCFLDGDGKLAGRITLVNIAEAEKRMG